MSDPEGLNASELASCGASGGYAIPPTPLNHNETWLLKVSISLQRGAIFQHKAVLSYLTFTYSCHVLPSCLQVALKMAQDRNLSPTWPHHGLILAPKRPPRWLKIATWAQLGPTWLHLGLILAPKRPPRGPQEAPKRPQEAVSSP